MDGKLLYHQIQLLTTHSHHFLYNYFYSPMSQLKVIYTLFCYFILEQLLFDLFFIRKLIKLSNSPVYENFQVISCIFSIINVFELVIHLLMMFYGKLIYLLDFISLNSLV